MKFDEILDQIGNLGKYQKRITFCICVLSIASAFLSLSVIFLLDIPSHRCSISKNDSYAIQSDSHAQIVNMSIPWETERGQPIRSSCYMYKQPINASHVSNETTKCSSWVFDKSIYQSTLTEQFEIVCDKRIYRSHTNMASYSGFLVGVLLYGFLSDRFGRRPLILIGLFLHVISFIAISFSPNVYVYMALRAFTHLNEGGEGTVSYVLALELTGPPKRVVVGMAIMIAWTTGLFLLGLLAYFVRYWQTLQLIISVPCVSFAVLYWILPESPRWLISRGRINEAQVIIRRMAKTNEVELPEVLLEKLQQEETVKRESVTKMFKSRPLLIMSLVIFFNWFVCSLVYYGLGLNVQNLSGDIYLNFTIANIAEMASNFFCLFLLDRVGRKFLHCLCMFVGGIACISTMFPVLYGTSALDWVTVLLSMVGKFGVAAAFSIIYIHTSEMFPTIVRISGVATSSVCARVGGIISPYIADLGIIVGGDLKIALPLIVFGAASVAAGLFSLYLPETLGKKLPETIEDAKSFKKLVSASARKPNDKSDKEQKYDILETTTSTRM